MITGPDFSKKQILFVFFNEGEKLAFRNDNLIVKTKDDKIKFQCSCYRLFLVYAIGNSSLTTVLIQKAKKFGFFIALYTQGFRLYAMVGADKDSNTLLHRKQYSYNGIELARFFVQNKISAQYHTLMNVRHKSDYLKESLQKIKGYYDDAGRADSINALMSYEGLTAKLYFKSHFNNTVWNGRQPRVKADIVNTTLDIGYTLLFSFVEALLASYGFDLYCGVLHQQFYMRKSLVCDFVEPFRPIVDNAVKKAINLKQISSEDFIIQNHQYRLKWEKNPDYVSFIMSPIIASKDEIFMFIQAYYRCFMKGCPIENYPTYNGSVTKYGSNQL